MTTSGYPHDLSFRQSCARVDPFGKRIFGAYRGRAKRPEPRRSPLELGRTERMARLAIGFGFSR